MTLLEQYRELEGQLQRGIAAHLSHGWEWGPCSFGKRRPISLAPEPLEQRWQRIVDALPDSPAERTELRRWLQRRIVRYGLRRMRAGTASWWQRRLSAVRVDTVSALRALGHEGLAMRLEVGP